MSLFLWYLVAYRDIKIINALEALSHGMLCLFYLRETFLLQVKKVRLRFVFPGDNSGALAESVCFSL